MNFTCQLHKRFEATTMEFFNAQVSRTKLKYSTLGAVSYGSLLRFNYVVTSLKNTLLSYKKKST